jgi:hypothetical protein
MGEAIEIGHSLTGVKLGEPQTYVNLTLFPLIGDESEPPPYTLLDEALERGLVHVTEVSAGGSVPELAFENASDESVLLVDGDELVGAKQNRVLNLSILVSGGKKLVIPVSCVEQGRWAYRSPEFRASKRALFAKARARKAQGVSDALCSCGERGANQSQVWADVADKARAFRVQSHTLALTDIYLESAPRLDDYAGAFRALPGQRGAVIAVGERVVGLELFDSASAFSRYLEKLVRAYALDAMETSNSDQPPPDNLQAKAFIDRVWATRTERFPALGEGEDIRLVGQGITGGALAAGGRLVHLAAFAVAQDAL